MKKLDFDEATHTYSVGGVVYPGVTTIIKPLYSLDGPSEAVLEYARGRGHAVHKACEIFNLSSFHTGSIAEASFRPYDCFAQELDPVIKPYFDAWLKFIKQSRVTISGAEQRLFHPTMKYAGTFDARGTMEGTKEDQWLFDIKAIAKLHPSVGVQLAAYEKLVEENDVRSERGPGVRRRRAAVQLKPDGNYVFQEYKGMADWPTFVSCYNVHNFRVNNHVE